MNDAIKIEATKLPGWGWALNGRGYAAVRVDYGHGAEWALYMDEDVDVSEAKHGRGVWIGTESTLRDCKALSIESEAMR